MFQALQPSLFWKWGAGMLSGGRECQAPVHQGWKANPLYVPMGWGLLHPLQGLRMAWRG